MDDVKAKFYPPLRCASCDSAYFREYVNGSDVLIHPATNCVEAGQIYEAPVFTLKRHKTNIHMPVQFKWQDVTK